MAIALGIIIAFSILRTRATWAYSPRFRQDSSQCPPLPSGLLSWVPALIKVDEDLVFKHAGLDAVVYVKFFARSFNLFIVGMVIGAVMLTVNWFGGNGQIGFGSIGLSNVKPGSHLLAAHVVGIYLFTGWCFYLLRVTYADYTILRHRHFAEKQGTEARSVLVNYLPPDCRTKAQMEKFFTKTYPDTFESAAITNWSSKREEIFKHRETAITNLEVALCKLSQKGVRPMIRKGALCKKTDAIDYYTGEVTALNKELAEVPLATEARAGFVTFSTLRDAHEASMVTLDTTPFAFRCRLAPELRDVCWENLGMHHRVKNIRALLGHATVFALIVFSFIPIAAISAITTLPNLTKILPAPVADYINSQPVLSGFLSGFLPSLANLVFLALLPIMLMAIAKFEGLEAYSWIEQRMSSFFFAFCVLTFFIAQTLAGSLLNSLTKIMENFNINDIIALLANSIPQYGYFFGILILMRAFVTLPLSLLAPGPLVITFLKRHFAVTTERQLRVVEKAAPICYGQEFPNHLMIFVIATSYAMIQPVIMLFAATYFAIGYLVSKYRVLYVAFPEYESGGLYWPGVFSRMCMGLFVSELTLIGVFGLKQVPVEAAFLIPLPFLTLAFWNYVRNEYHHLSEALPLSQTLAPSAEPAGGNEYTCPQNDPTPLSIPSLADITLVHAKGDTYYSFAKPEKVVDPPTEV